MAAACNCTYKGELMYVCWSSQRTWSLGKTLKFIEPSMKLFYRRGERERKGKSNNDWMTNRTYRKEGRK
jgi:hypothetical protein